MMLSAWTQFGLRILSEFWKERETGLKMTVPGLKRRIGMSIRTRGAGQALRSLYGASLLECELKNGRSWFYYSGETENATLYDLIMAMDGRVGFGARYINGRSYTLPPEFIRVADIEAAFDREVVPMLMNIRLGDLLPVKVEVVAGQWFGYCSGMDCPDRGHTGMSKESPETTCSPVSVEIASNPDGFAMMRKKKQEIKHFKYE